MNPEEIEKALDEKNRFEKEDKIKKAEALKKKRKRVLFSAFFILAACIFVYYNNPQQIHMPACLSLTVFKVYCPACGMTRAAYYILHLDIVRAFYFNQFLVITLPFFAYIYAADAVNTYFDKKILPLFKFNKALTYTIIALFVLYGILRNIEAFNFLAPRNIAAVYGA